MKLLLFLVITVVPQIVSSLIPYVVIFPTLVLFHYFQIIFYPGQSQVYPIYLSLINRRSNLRN